MIAAMCLGTSHGSTAADPAAEDSPPAAESEAAAGEDVQNPGLEATAAPGSTLEPVPRAEAGAATHGDSDSEAAAEITTESVVEAILFATDSPLPAAKIARILGVGDARSVKKHIESLNARYQQTGASFRIEEVAGGFQVLTLPAYNNWVSKLLSVRRETKLSPAALETLAVVAYRQPVLRADIEAIRGVAVGDILVRLREMGLVKIVGRAEVIGRPMLYGTTKKFLEVFGLASLEDLPKVDALALPPQKEAAGDSQSDRPGASEVQS
jgi:segregation and condensation protein B